jgi:hypothetical protein
VFERGVSFQCSDGFLLGKRSAKVLDCFRQSPEA